MVSAKAEAAALNQCGRAGQPSGSLTSKAQLALEGEANVNFQLYSKWNPPSERARIAPPVLGSRVTVGVPGKGSVVFCY